MAWTRLLLGIAALAASAACPVFGQDNGAAAPPNVPNPSAGGNLLTFFTNRTPYEFWLTCVIGLLGIAVVGALIYAVGRMEKPRPEDLTRPIIILILVIAALILVTAGYSNDQIAPAFGLFGTIAGYLFGRSTAIPPAAKADGPHDEAAPITPAPSPQPVGAPVAGKPVVSSKDYPK